jgi:hypothetical protein
LSGKSIRGLKLKIGATKYQSGVSNIQQQCLVYTVYSVLTILKLEYTVQYFTKSHNYKINEHENEYTQFKHALYMSLE